MLKSLPVQNVRDNTHPFHSEGGILVTPSIPNTPSLLSTPVPFQTHPKT
jgi:hypothetical protein